MSVTQFFQKKNFTLPPYWKLACLRCAIYSFMVGWGAFETGVEGFDSLSDLTQLQKWKLLGSIAVSIGGVWLAFLDNTLSKMNNPPPSPPSNQNPTA